MKKTLIVSLIICILAIGTVGYAFATNLNFTNGVGALSTGIEKVTDANVTGIFWGLEDNYNSSVGPVFNNVRLQFDKYLVKGTVVAATILKADGTVLAGGEFDLNKDVSAGGDIKVFFSNVDPALADSIRVTVGEPRPYK